MKFDFARRNCVIGFTQSIRSNLAEMFDEPNIINDHIESIQMVQ